MTRSKEGRLTVHFFVKCCPLEPARLWSPLSIHPTVRSESAVAQCSTFSTVTPTALSSTSAVLAQCTPTSTSTFALTHDTHCIDPVDLPYAFRMDTLSSGSSLGSESTPATLPCHRCPSSVARLPCAVVAVALAMSGGFLAWVRAGERRGGQPTYVAMNAGLRDQSVSLFQAPSVSPTSTLHLARPRPSPNDIPKRLEDPAVDRSL
ncbi:hypothetical protein C8F01DRAFT_1155924 [Mycena amicta]|nr:hypothetical protein C8F01DRAFT_1155924 [Mycena amicta]